MLQFPEIYNKYDRTPLDSVYETLDNEDLSDCVVSAMKVLKESDNFVPFIPKQKSSSDSLEYGVEGKKAFFAENYQMALVKYNMALMTAPHGSETMMLAYYSRAELLLKTKQFSACLKDIDTCLSMNCPEKIVNQLQNMKEAARKFAWVETLVTNMKNCSFSDQFFKLKEDRNPDVPFVTSDVEIIMESGKPKVVAAKDIPVGTLLALETMFVGGTYVMNHITACYYCQKMSFNVMPCDGCCSAVFCDEHCKKQAIQEGHDVECKIIDVILEDIQLPVKATIKMRKMCSSWDEFITASNNLCNGTMKNSSVAELFSADKFSLLKSHADRHFKYGLMFNVALYVANILHYLAIKTLFFPHTAKERAAAIRAVSRVIMHLSIHCTPVQLQLYTKIQSIGLIGFHNHPNKGYFPFIGNLTNCCVPNSYVVALRNSAALLTIMPIKKGAEITVSYMGHWLEVESEEYEARASKLFMHYRTICENCMVCNNDKKLREQSLNEKQREVFKHFSKTDYMKNFPQNVRLTFNEACKALQTLSDVPYSKEYYEVHRRFMQCIIHCVQEKYPNIIMEKYE